MRLGLRRDTAGQNPRAAERKGSNPHFFNTFQGILPRNMLKTGRWNLVFADFTVACGMPSMNGLTCVEMK